MLVIIVPHVSPLSGGNRGQTPAHSIAIPLASIYLSQVHAVRQSPTWSWLFSLGYLPGCSLIYCGISVGILHKQPLPKGNIIIFLASLEHKVTQFHHLTPQPQQFLTWQQSFCCQGCFCTALGTMAGLCTGSYCTSLKSYRACRCVKTSEHDFYTGR